MQHIRSAAAGSRWSFPASIAVHALVLALGLGASLPVIQAVRVDPRASIGFVLSIPEPPAPAAPPAPAGGGGGAAGAGAPEAAPAAIPRADEPPILEEAAGDFAQVFGLGAASGDGGGLPGGSGSGGDGPGGGPGDGPGLPGVSGEPGGGPLVPTADMVLPVLLRRVEPEYPEAARVARLPGQVVLTAVIERDGGVGEVEVLQSTNRLFEAPAAEAVRRWAYRPARLDGRPVAVYFTVVVRFELR